MSIPEARAALETFAANRMAALDAVSRGVRTALSQAIDQLLNAEMGLFLGRPDQKSNRRNGYITREYSLKGIGTLKLRVPRDRNGVFDSVVIPAREQMDPRLRQDLALLHLAGISSRTLATIARKVLGMEVSRETVLSTLGTLEEAAQKWLTRPLTRPYWALFIDATNFHVRRRGSTELEPSLVVIGVDEENHRSILAVEPGLRENKEAWQAAFEELKKRGLKAADVRVGVMDGLPGLENAFCEGFPKAVVCRCWLHAKDNALAKIPARLAVPFKELVQKVMYAASEDSARKAFSKLKEAMGDDGQRAVSCIEKDLEALVAHYRFERRFWQALKTTNAVERVHSEIKRRIRTMDAIGEGNLAVVVAFTALRLEAGWRTKRIDSRSIYNLNTEALKIDDSKESTTEAMQVLTTSG